MGRLYEKAVLEGVPEQPLAPPPGIVTVNIDRSTGQLASGGNSRERVFHRRHAAGTTGGTRWELPLLIMVKHTNVPDQKALRRLLCVDLLGG
ncbi:hypothetical protein KCP74_07685 [Salmonella enterica subsp. enterica]|nr:hypothetical protein KCP74_07685 [Salmonella enterica subsp. enterica]